MSANVDPILAVLSAMAYQAGRSRQNLLNGLSPEGVIYVPDESLAHFSDDDSGFEASAFLYNGQVVISYAGTLPGFADLSTDLMLSVGIPAEQLKQAAASYERVKQAYGDNIVFTGHSLGGGIAALMGVFFDKTAITFNQAPFRLSATQSVAEEISEYLADAGFAPDSDLLSFTTTETLLIAQMPELVAAASLISPLLGAALGPRSFPTAIRGEENVTAVAMEGDFLLAGGILTAAQLEQLRIEGGPVQIIQNGGVGTLGGGLDEGVALHSMNLLAAFIVEPELAEVTLQLPNLVKLLLDDSLYSRKPEIAQSDILVQLLRNHYSSSSSDTLGKFTADLQKLVGNAGVAQVGAGVRDALMVAAMEYYYFKPPASATDLFDVSDGGIHFRYSDINASSGYKSLRMLKTAIAAELASAERLLAQQLLTKDAWHIQSGSAALTWTSDNTGTVNDAAIGGGEADTIDSGIGSDIVVGGDGNDTITGGAGNDTLLGGNGNDTYRFAAGAGSDVIVDADGSGSLMFGAQQIGGGDKLSEGYWITDPAASGQHFTFSLVANSIGGADLIIGREGSNDTITVRNWAAGQLGITLSDSPANIPPPTGSFTGDYVKLLQADGVSYQLDSLANYVADTSQPLGPQPDAIYGTVDGDTLSGGAENDILSGGIGDDVLEGGAGDDVLAGDTGLDTLNGGDGNDYIYGSGLGYQLKPTRTDDPPPTNEGTELSRGFGWAVYDTGVNQNGRPSYAVVGALVTTLVDDDTSIIDGGAGNDLIRAGSGSDVVHGGADNDDILGLARGDTLYGDGGDDVIFGDGVITTGVVESVTASEHGSDAIDGGAGNDTLIGQGGDDFIFGDAGNDHLWGDQFMTGVAAQDDTPLGVHGNDHLDGGDDSDDLHGGGLDDLLFGGSGNDWLYGDDDPESVEADYHGADILDGGAGIDYLEGGGGDDVLFGGADSDTLVGDLIAAGTSGTIRGFDLLDGEAGNDTLVGGALSDTLFGGEDNDTLYGDGAIEIVDAEDHADDILNGGAGEDALIGGGGSDTLFGGLDNDILRGDDSAIPADVQGNDYLAGEGGNDYLHGEGGADTLIGGTENDFLYGDSSDTPQGAQGDDYLDGGEGTDYLVGGGGADIVLGGTGNDTLFGEAGDTPAGVQGDDYLNGGEGVDTLVGGGGSDILLGGSGNDSLYGEAADTPAGTEGDDYLDGEAGDDILAGGGGNDILIGGADHDVLAGEAGNDRLETDSGNDVLSGGAGNDTYVLGLGAGHVQITDMDGANAVLFGGGIISSDLTLELLGPSARINFSANDYAFMSLATLNTLTSVRFADGEDWTADDLLHAFQPGPVGSDHSIALAAGVSTQEISVLRWNDDLVMAYGGSITNWVDTSSFGSRGVAYRTADGADYGLSAGTRVLTLVNWYRATPGDYLNQLREAGGATADLVPMSAAALITRTGSAGDDVIVGTASAETFRGGAGADELLGAAGSDTYVFNVGDGSDLIQDSAGADDVVRFGSGITPASLTVSETNAGLTVVVGAAGNGDALTIEDWSRGGAESIDRFVFADGVSINRAQIDALNTGNHSPRVAGTIGQQTVRVGQTFSYSVPASTFSDADAGDTLTYTASGPQGASLPAWLTFNPATRTFSGTPAAGDISTTPITVQVSDAAGLTNAMTFDLQVITVIVLTGTADSNVLSAQTGNDYELYGLGGNDFLYGNIGNDVLVGGTGDDYLEGGAGNDDLSGGVGRDRLIGGAGDDSYRFGHSQGFDEITDTAGVNRLVLDAGITPSNVTLYRTSSTGVLGSSGSAAADDLVLVLGNSAEQIRVIDFYAAQTPRPIDQIVFADGTVWNAAAIASRTTSIAGAVNTFTGTNKNNAYTVDNPNDTINETVSGGTDSVSASVSYVLPANVENLTLTGTFHVNGTGNSAFNVITGNALDNVLDGAAGFDTLYGMGGSDTFKYYDDAADDSLRGGSGDDTYFIGIEPSGSVYGAPTDTVVEASNEGYDTVYAMAWEYTLPNNVERVIFQPVSGSWTGNISEWTINGNSADNYIDASLIRLQLSRNFVIDAGAGADTVIAVDGFRAANRIVVDNIGDVVIGADGDDTIVSSISYTLSETLFTPWGPTGSLELTGAAPISGTGNTANNQLNGSTSTAANVLSGGLGDDTYILGAGDTALENASAGNDTLIATFVRSGANAHRVDDYANIENLSVSDAAQAATLVGSSQANALTGNASSNVLDGGAGNDVLKGNGGDDRYVGFNRASGHDVISDASGNDAIEFSSAVNVTGRDLSIERADNDLVMEVSPQSSIRIESWYTGNRVERLTLFNEGIQYDYTAAQIEAGALGTNGAPVAMRPLSNIVAMPGQVLSHPIVPNAFTDLESQSVLSYSATRADGSPLPDWLSLDSQTGVFSGQPAPSDVGGFLLKVTATDEGGLSATTEVLLDVGGVVQIGTAGNDTLSGGATPDYLQGLGGNDSLDGRDGNDDLLGGAGDDVLIGGAGGDRLQGGTGYDRYSLDGNSGNDVITEADGFDRVEFANGSGVTIGNLQATRIGSDLRLAYGTNTVTVVDQFLNTGKRVEEFVTYNAGTPYVYSAAQIEALASGVNSAPYAGSPISDKALKANVTWTYQIPANTFTDTQSQSGLTYAARLVGGAALPSWLSFNASTRTFSGRAPSGTNADFAIEILASDPSGLSTAASFNLRVRRALSTWTGTAGNDTTAGTSGHDYQIGLAGNDSLNGGAGNDIQEGGDGNDVLIGGAGDDFSYGGAGNDILQGEYGGRDTLYGNEGDDSLRSNSSAGTLIGGSGNDVFYVASQPGIFLQGGDGADTYRYDDDYYALDGTIDNHSDDAELDRLVLQRMDRSYLRFSRSGNDLLIRNVQYSSSQTPVMVSAWFSDSRNRLDEIETSGGLITTADQIDALIASGQSAFASSGFTAFDAAPAADLNLSSWSLTNALLTQHLGESDTAAIGGELAYRHGQFGTSSDISFMPAVGILGAAGFGSSAQTLQSLASLQDSLESLSAGHRRLQ